MKVSFTIEDLQIVFYQMSRAFDIALIGNHSVNLIGKDKELIQSIFPEINYKDSGADLSIYIPSVDFSDISKIMNLKPFSDGAKLLLKEVISKCKLSLTDVKKIYELSFTINKLNEPINSKITISPDDIAEAIQYVINSDN